MDDTALASLVAIGVSALLQTLKDQLNLGSTSLRWVAAVTGAVVGGGAGYVGGAESVAQIVQDIGLGALVVTGFHSLVLQDSVLGRVLKAVGEALFKKPATP